MKNAFAIITFCFLTACFSILWLAVLMQLEQHNQFANYFAVAFVGGCLSFLGYLKLENRKTK
jgi:hypothetical protein